MDRAAEAAQRGGRTEASVARPRTGRPAWPLFLGLALVVFVVDQLTKAAVAAALAPGESVSVVGDLVRLVHGRNTGALFGLFRDQATLFAVVSIGVIALIVWYHRRAGRSAVLSVALGLLLGGALGNLADRVRLGYVLDFVDAGIGDLRWYTFNVADAAISTAILLLLVVGLRPSVAGVGERAGGRPGPEADG